ncbi:MAG TPA: hypothetical protein PKH79_02505 [Prolixibacteraceae bacterium]|nr:hypothetical protein [Prolixibacteraceae bacterium]HPS12914.1 hypothetical protein [Prolixibacteraceae bacterium]
MNKIRISIFLFIGLVGFTSVAQARLLPGENVFQLQLNKSLFVSGEKIWFKNSLVSGDKSEHNNILFVDLCGEGSVISSRILERENRHWQGDIVIPDSLETGIYLLRAYIGDYNGNSAMVTQLVTIINRFGNNQGNQRRKENPHYQPLNLVDRVPQSSGNGLKAFVNSESFKTKEPIECRIEKGSSVFPSGISFNVYKVPEIESGDSAVSQNTYETKVEYAGTNELKIYNRLTLCGKVTGKISKQPVADERVFFSVPDSIPQINYATTDSNGVFCFDLDEYYGDQDVIVQTYTKNVEYEITLFSGFLNPPSKIPFYIPGEVEKSQFVADAIQRAQLQKAYPLQEEKPVEKNSFRYPFYGVASNMVFPGKYIELNDFEEIAKEILPLCRIRKEKGKEFCRIVDPTNFINFDNPWLLVDGVPVYDVKQLSPLNSPKIKRVETQAQLRCYGDLLIEGAVSVITSNGHFKDIPLPVNAIRTSLQTIYLPVEFPGNHFRLGQNFADFRDVLYWKPLLEPFAQTCTLSVNSSYEKGSYVAVVEGIDADGTVQRAVCKFKLE